MVADGAGGAIAVWVDSRIVPDKKLYAQRINAWGYVQWAVDGEALCKIYPDGLIGWARFNLVSDGAGGAIVVWPNDGQTFSHIYAQRVDATGGLPWGVTDGVPVCLAPIEQTSPVIVSDDAGGAIIAWVDRRASPTSFDIGIYAQRIDAAGVVQWTTDGIPVCTASEEQRFPIISSDGAHGAIVAWADLRNHGGTFEADAYAQRVNAAGVPQWTADGIALSTASGDQSPQVITALAVGGAVVGAAVAWFDNRSNPNWDLYAQAVDVNGTVLWTADGSPACTAPSSKGYITMAPDAASGAIIGWDDFRGVDGYSDIYAQRLDGTGSAVWATDGVAICDALNNQERPSMAADGSGGAIIAWGDQRAISSGTYAQRVSPLGISQWNANGIPVCTLPSSRPVVVPDDAGGAIVGWWDGRVSSQDPNIYAWRIGPDGNPTAVNPAPRLSSLTLDPNFPNPFESTTSLEFQLAADSDVEIEIYDVAGRKVRNIFLGNTGAGARQIAFDGLDDAGRPLSSGVYFYRVRAAGETVTRKMVITR